MTYLAPYICLFFLLFGCSNNFTSPEENEVIKIVNEERLKMGLSKLKTTKELTKAANKRAKELVTVFSHTRPNGTSSFTVLKEYNISFYGAGENIATGQKTPKDVMNSWMNSTGHKANILGDFTRIGIGHHLENNKDYWVELFIKD